MNYKIALLLSFWSTLFATDLNHLALEFDTDKGPQYHNYTPVYQKFFDELRHQPITFLEIGFYKGGSAKMWDCYFSHPQAQLHYIDIDQTYKNKLNWLSSRNQLHMVDQANAAVLSKFAHSVNGQFDIIIDDGGHTMEQQIVSFKTLFPFVKSKGIYIIEDLHTSYWSWYGGSGSPETPATNKFSTIMFLQNLVHDLNFVGASTQCADKAKCPDNLKRYLSIYQDQIESIHFYSSVCVIVKV